MTIVQQLRKPDKETPLVRVTKSFHDATSEKLSYVLITHIPALLGSMTPLSLLVFHLYFGPLMCPILFYLTQSWAFFSPPNWSIQWLHIISKLTLEADCLSPSSQLPNYVSIVTVSSLLLGSLSFFFSKMGPMIIAL